MTNHINVKSKRADFLNRFVVPSGHPPTPHVYLPKGIPFMVHPERSHTSPLVYLMQIDKRWHLVDPTVMASGVRLPGIWKARLYQTILESGETVLLPVTSPVSEDYASWFDSITDIIGMARNAWVTVESIPAERRYAVVQTKAMRSQPAWPSALLDELMERAFTGRIVDMQHPLVQAVPSRTTQYGFEVEEDYV